MHAPPPHPRHDHASSLLVPPLTADPLPRLKAPTRPLASDRRDLQLLEQARPPSLRDFDQIPMCGLDLQRQARLFLPLLTDACVAFMGDSDGLSLLLGLRCIRGGSRPAELHLLDFDERLLNAALKLAANAGFGNLLHAWRYNVFDPVPAALIGRCDFFVTNPPYGMRNAGESARLFIARATEVITPSGGGGAIILPDDPTRPWTGQAMRATVQFLARHGWERRAQRRALHHYHLDDDPGLASDLVLVSRIAGTATPSPYAGRRVDVTEIPHFYGYGTPLPYPRYIASDGTFDYDWSTNEDQTQEWQRPRSDNAA